MALETIWLGKASVGLGDGSTWEDRGALLDGDGHWTSLLTGFDFSGGDYLECRIAGEDDHNCTQPLSSALFANAPAAYQARFVGLNNDGSAWTPPFWMSDMPYGWVDTVPRIIHNPGAVTGASARCIDINIPVIALSIDMISGSAANSAPFQAPLFLSWCHGRRASANGNHIFQASNPYYANCVGEVDGTTATSGPWINAGTPYWFNCRAVGGSSGFSGSQNAAYFAVNSTVSGAINGFSTATVAQDRSFRLDHCTIVASSVGVSSDSATATNSTQQITNCFIVAPTGLDFTNKTVQAPIAYNRIRATTPITAAADSFIGENYTAAGSDEAEFVDAANGDYRIKFGSAYWDLGVGVSREPAPSGGGGANLHPLQGIVTHPLGWLRT